MSIKDLIAAAYNKDATAFESAFQSVMQDKVSAAVENAFTAEEAEEDLDEAKESPNQVSDNIDLMHGDKEPTRESAQRHISKHGGASLKVTKISHGEGGGGASIVHFTGNAGHVAKLMNHTHGENYPHTNSGYNSYTRDFHESYANEEVEELDELSKNTVRSYYNKAGEQGRDITGKMMVGGGDWSKDGKDTETLKKRAAGRAMALKRRSGEVKMSEEVELDEVSSSTLGSYIRKSSKDYEASMKKRDSAIDDSDRDTARAMGMRARKRGLGVDMAVDKLKGNRYVKVPAATKMSEETDGHVSAAFDYMPDHDKKPSSKEIKDHVQEFGGDSIKIKRVDHGGPAGGASEVQISGHPKHVMKLMNHHHDENYSLDHAGHAEFMKNYG